MGEEKVRSKQIIQKMMFLRLAELNDIRQCLVVETAPAVVFLLGLRSIDHLMRIRLDR